MVRTSEADSHCILRGKQGVSSMVLTTFRFKEATNVAASHWPNCAKMTHPSLCAKYCVYTSHYSLTEGSIAFGLQVHLFYVKSSYLSTSKHVSAVTSSQFAYIYSPRSCYGHTVFFCIIYSWTQLLCSL